MGSSALRFWWTHSPISPLSVFVINQCTQLEISWFDLFYAHVQEVARRSAAYVL